MKKIFFILYAALFSTFALAQDGGGGGTTDINVDINKDGGNWYTSPWIWVVVAAVFILLLVALTRGGGRRD